MSKLKDVLKNIDQFRGRSIKKIAITPEQKEFLLTCRDHENPVPFDKMAELWAELGWGNFTGECVRKRYLIAKGKI